MKSPAEYRQPPLPRNARDYSTQHPAHATGKKTKGQTAHALQAAFIDNSPRQVTQRRSINNNFGMPVQNKKNKTGIPDEVKAKMETHLNTDLSSVRVHAESSKVNEVGALAYTQGNDVHFAPGQYRPDTAQGKQLLGHELAHVVQQRQGRVAPTGEVGGMPLNEDPKLEEEADVMGKKIG